MIANASSRFETLKVIVGFSVLLISELGPVSLCAQQKKDFVKVFQGSLTPGLSTNGLHPGGYKNYFSLHLTSGYSSANYLLEIGVISNLNVEETRGIQIAGIANLTGANAYAGMQLKEESLKKKSGFEANLSGGQFSGLANVVLTNVFGWQATGGMNVTNGALVGFQLGGIANTVKKYSFGIQLAGGWNVSAESMNGVMTAGLFNITQGGLYGLQIACVNKAGLMEGKNSYTFVDPTGVQIGLLNYANQMNGYQVGLVNWSKRSQGTQVGLVNIYRRGTLPETRDGTAIGLLNIGSAGYAAVYATELFYTNFEIATGTIKNLRMRSERMTVEVQNALVYSRDPGFSSRHRWSVGYGLRKAYFTRSDIPGMAGFRFFSYGLHLMHINHEQNKFTRSLSLLARPAVTFGTRIHPKLRMVYLFASVSYNFYWTETGIGISPSVLESTGTLQGKLLQQWPGFSAGIHLQ